MRCCLLSIAFFTATLAAQQAAQPKQPLAKAESCSIEGQVVNAVTGEPLTKATIDLWPVANGQELRYDAVTTAGGRFVIRDIESGQYRMRASKRGYAAGEYSASGTSRTGTTLSLDPGQQLKNVVLAHVAAGGDYRARPG